MKKGLITGNVHCTGCSACAVACPIHCISILQNNEGFYKAVVNDQVCIKCGKCNTVCPVQTPPQYSNGLYWSAAITKDNDVYLHSTSGGAFFEICRSIFELYSREKIFYFGAAWENKSTVIHKYVDQLDNIVVFQKSKYIQSDVRDTFLKVKDFLEDGAVVVYSGTPCQIAGLKNFLGKDFKKLFLIDFICHGVGSPKVFDRCISELEDKQNDTVKNYSFRWKKIKLYRTQSERHVSHIDYNSNKSQNIQFDNYNKFFLSQLCLNSSCAENCIFRSKERCSDFTIADFNGFSSIFPHICDERHYSSVIANSKKALAVLEQLHSYMDIFECKCSDIEKYQPCYNSHPKGNSDRDAFFDMFLKGETTDKLINRFGVQFRIGIKGKLIRVLPYTVLFLLKKIKKRISGGVNLFK